MICGLLHRWQLAGFRWHETIPNTQLRPVGIGRNTLFQTGGKVSILPPVRNSRTEHNIWKKINFWWLFRKYAPEHSLHTWRNNVVPVKSNFFGDFFENVYRSTHSIPVEIITLTLKPRIGHRPDRPESLFPDWCLLFHPKTSQEIYGFHPRWLTSLSSVPS